MKIKKLMQDRGLTLAEVAADLMISERTVYRWLDGTRKPHPRDEKFIRLVYGIEDEKAYKD